jgi:glycosyl transferase, family 25
MIEENQSLYYDNFYVLNLKRSNKRREKISAELDKAGISYKIFEAVDGFFINIQDLDSKAFFTGKDIKTKAVRIQPNKNYKLYCTPDNSEENSMIINGGFKALNAGEFGIWCSHKLLWKDIIKNNYQKTIIVEDDFLPPDNFGNKLYNFITSIPNDFDIAYLGVSQLRGKTEKIIENQFVEKLPEQTNWWAAWGLVVSRQAALKLDNSPIYVMALDDFFLKCAKDNGHKSFIKEKLNVYVSSEKLVGVKPEELTGNSEIGRMGPRNGVPESTETLVEILGEVEQL